MNGGKEESGEDERKKRSILRKRKDRGETNYKKRNGEEHRNRERMT